MIKIEEISPVLECASIERSVMYFKECLGFECTLMQGEPAKYALIEREGRKIHLTKSDKVNPSCIFLLCHDFKEIFRECTNNQAKLILGPKKIPGRTLEFKVRDLDGNLLVFGEMPPAVSEQSVASPGSVVGR